MQTHVWENSGSRDLGSRAPDQSDCSILLLLYLVPEPVPIIVPEVVSSSIVLEPVPSKVVPYSVPSTVLSVPSSIIVQEPVSSDVVSLPMLSKMSVPVLSKMAVPVLSNLPVLSLVNCRYQYLVNCQCQCSCFFLQGSIQLCLFHLPPWARV